LGEKARGWNIGLNLEAMHVFVGSGENLQNGARGDARAGAELAPRASPASARAGLGASEAFCS